MNERIHKDQIIKIELLKDKTIFVEYQDAIDPNTTWHAQIIRYFERSGEYEVYNY